MKINKKLLIPLISAFAAVFIVFLVIGLTGNSEKEPDTLPSTSAETQLVTSSTPQTEENTLKLSFIGDCVLGGDPVDYGYESFIWYSENYPLSYFFEKVKSELSNDDFTLANMETVLTDNFKLKPEDKGDGPAFWFMAKSKNAEILTEGSVEVAGVVNNHTADFGDEGYSDTVKALEDAGLLVGEDCIPLYFEKNGIKVGVVYANLWAYYQVNYITEALEEIKDKCDYKIVFFHGGEEGQHEPDNFKIDACRDLANSGLCDLIVGAHPHVLQPLEVVNGVPILYSLGNFCFAGNNYPENKTVIFKANLTKNDDGSISAETKIVPCYVYTGDINSFQPAIITDEEDKQEILTMLSAPVDYIEETEPTTTTAPQTEAQTEEYITEETEEVFFEETEAPSEAYTEEYTEEYIEEIETAISYY
ncbi:MAG: CapA family protein [Clostridia bacterium]|nr:CapA family protein [Clostridia bacterium]